MSKVIIIGDSSHNTLGAVRSFGEAKIPIVLLLVCAEDVCFVHKSKYLRNNNLFTVSSLDECPTILESLSKENGQILMTTFDAAAEWVDSRENVLSDWFITPCRGKQIGPLFDKSKQCELAKECGFDVPYSVVFHRNAPISEKDLVYPLILKPLVSSAGAKSDIHICPDRDSLIEALSSNSACESFVIQQFIEKEFELDAMGIFSDDGLVMGGAVRKYRHWPRLIGAGAFGIIEKIDTYNVNIPAIETFMKKSGYHGPFSIELLHTKDGKNYFMEVNFRNEGLAYASTCAGANLHALYADPSKAIEWKKFRPTYMMNYSIDYLYVKEGDLSRHQWFRDFIKTRCFINFCLSDIKPLLAYYKKKFCQ